LWLAEAVGHKEIQVLVSLAEEEEVFSNKQEEA
jgi:hypothetical protein